jgi:hypothetical protein
MTAREASWNHRIDSTIGLAIGIALFTKDFLREFEISRKETEWDKILSAAPGFWDLVYGRRYGAQTPVTDGLYRDFLAPMALYEGVSDVPRFLAAQSILVDHKNSSPEFGHASRWSLTNGRDSKSFSKRAKHISSISSIFYRSRKLSWSSEMRTLFVGSASDPIRNQFEDREFVGIFQFRQRARAHFVETGGSIASRRIFLSTTRSRGSSLVMDILWPIRSGGGHIHRDPSKASCIAKQPILCILRMSNEWSFGFSWRETQMRKTFTAGFRYSWPMTLTVFEVSDAGVSSSGKGKKRSTTILGEGRDNHQKPSFCGWP